MWQQLTSFLGQPYPDEDDIRSFLKTAFWTFLVVSLVLAGFQPFGLRQTGPSIWGYALTFGLLSAAVTFGFDLVMRYVFKIRRDRPTWTLGKWVLTVLILVGLISLANYSYIIWKGFAPATALGYLSVLASTYIVGIVPIILFGSFNMIRNLKANQEIAAHIPEPTPSSVPTPPTQIIQLPIQSSEKTFAVEVSQLCYLEAQQNYVVVVYQTEVGVEKEMLRNTLSKMEAALEDTTVRRAHRSYLVNTQRIRSVSGNAQGLKLQLEGLDELEIPVSRKYIPDFR